MIYIRGTTDFHFDGTCVTVGKFDGLHAGHQVLLDELKRYEAQGLTSVMLTFEFAEEAGRTEAERTRLMTPAERFALLEKRGPQVCIEYPFTRETMMTEAYDFLKDVLIGQLGASVIVMGDDFRFGKGRAGDAAFLTAHEAEFGYKTVVCPRLTIDGETVSSSVIREKIARGELNGARSMLNRGYFDKKD